MLYRELCDFDIDECIALGAMMHSESRYASLDYSHQKMRQLGNAILDYPDSYFCLLAEDMGEIVGLIIGYVVPHWFGNDLTSGDLAVYVAPSHRHGMVGVKLIRAYTDWAISKGVKEPLLGVSAGIMPERIGALYKRMGYTDEYKIYKMPAKV